MRPDYLSLSRGYAPLAFGGAAVGATTMPSPSSSTDPNSLTYKILHPSQGELIAAGIGGVGGFLLFGTIGAVVGAVGLPILVAAMPPLLP